MRGTQGGVESSCAILPTHDIGATTFVEYGDLAAMDERHVESASTERHDGYVHGGIQNPSQTSAMFGVRDVTLLRGPILDEAYEKIVGTSEA